MAESNQFKCDGCKKYFPLSVMVDENYCVTCINLLILNGKRPNTARGKVWYEYRHSAKKRGYEWDLSYFEFIDLISGNCHYCGAAPNNPREPTSQESSRIHAIPRNGIDRIDNTFGYFISNCVSCCSTCNTMKMDMTYKAFITHVISILRNLQQKKSK